MNQNTVYWVWLQRVLGYGNPKIKDVLAVYPSAKDFYHADLEQKRLCSQFSNTQLHAFSAEMLENSQTVVDRCKSLNYNIITLGDENYPRRLKEIYNPPCVLYVSGTLPDVDDYLCIAVVGTRTATREGIRTSFTMASELAKTGVIVVSGGALGIDCASHRGVLQSGGVTICVLGCGINYNYLMDNAQMRNLITQRGAVISEYPPDSPPLARNFPLRNRIISGLSNGILVIEAGEKSGSLITVNLALEQNRDVFAVPGSITNTVCKGSNNLIKQGAKTVTSYTDILEEYVGINDQPSESEPPKVNEDLINEIPTSARRPYIKSSDNRQTNANNENDVYTQTKKATAIETQTLSQDACRVADLVADIPVHIDVIVKETGLTVSRTLGALTELELSGIVLSQPGRRYCKA